MKSKTRFFLILLALAAAMLAGCSEDTTGTSVGDGSFATLRTYLIDNDLDLPDILSSWTILASDVEANPAMYYIMDIRADSTYDRGHIDGAVLSTLGGILTDATQSGGKPIVVACLSGQVAGHAVAALRLSGYPDAKVLKWGMSAWNADFDVWTPNTGSSAVGDANWSMGRSPGAGLLRVSLAGYNCDRRSRHSGRARCGDARRRLPGSQQFNRSGYTRPTIS